MRILLKPSHLIWGMAAALTIACQGNVFNANSTATLISAINSANGPGGPHTINLAAGTYNLSGELPIIAANRTITIQGGTANPADTVIHQQTAGQRIMETFFDGSANNVVLTINNVTFDNGQAGAFGGGALLVGGIGSATTVNNCVFSNNKSTAIGAGGGAISSSPNGDLTIIGCRFTGNTSTVFSGAVDFLNQSGGTGSLLIKDSVFLNNTAAADGGAIRTSAFNGSSTILNCNFEGNRTTTATGRGGVIQHGEGAMVMHYNRFFNNHAGTPANGDTFFQGSGATIGASDLTLNWWGANSGPSGTDLHLAAPVVNPVTTSPWLQLRHVPDATTLGSGGSTTLRADILGQNTGGPLGAANLSTTPLFPDAPATIFNNLTPALGSLSSSSTRFSQGKATSTFTAGSAKGTAQIKATLDNQFITANILLPVAVVSINRVSASPSNLGTVQWTVTFDGAVSGVAAGNFTLANTGLGGTPVITAVTASGGAPSATWIVSASTGAGAGTLGLNLTSVSGITPALSTGNIPLTGQIYTIDLVAPTTSLTGNPAANSQSASAMFTFIGNDANSGLAGFQFKLDGGAFLAATSPQNLIGLTEGSHTIQVRAIDNAGNVDASPESFTWTVDTTAPTVAISAPSKTITASGSVTYTVTYTDTHFNSSTLVNGNVTLNKTGNANGTVSVAPGSGAVRTVTISGITGDGTLGISLAAGTATDTAGNSAPAAGPSATFIVDNTPPTVAISAPSSSTTATGPVSFTVTYTDANFNSSTLAPGNVSLNTTETATGIVGVTGIGNTRTVTISGITGKGTLGISIAANTATDLAGNKAPAAGPSATFIVNHPPVAGTATIHRYPTESVKVKVAVLLGLVTDADSDVITLTGVQSPSPGGGAVVIKGDNVIYTPAPNFKLSDTFTYSVSDTRGGTATGTVKVNIVTDNTQSQNIQSIENLGGGVFRITFNGIPNRVYTIQFTTNLVDPWQALGTAQTDALGVGVYIDNTGSVSRLYRTVYP